MTTTPAGTGDADIARAAAARAVAEANAMECKRDARMVLLPFFEM
jgi:hypothetical protein